jgi:RimJ/RimL family protein N-acetyltransferase
LVLFFKKEPLSSFVLGISSAHKVSTMKSEFPKTVPIENGTIELRLMRPEDDAKVLAFARRLPTHDLLFLPRDITQPKVLAAWVRAIEAGHMTALLAWLGDDVVGCAAIFRDPHSWSPHVGELRVVTSPAMRGRGAGRALIRNCFEIMMKSGIEKIQAYMTIDQQGAIAVFESLGFHSEGLLHDHVQDRNGKRHDIVILSHDVAKVLDRMSAQGVAKAL